MEAESDNMIRVVTQNERSSQPPKLKQLILNPESDGLFFFGFLSLGPKPRPRRSLIGRSLSRPTKGQIEAIVNQTYNRQAHRRQQSASAFLPASHRGT